MAAPHHDWYLAEWLLHSGKKQEDLVRDLDWNKSKASLLAKNKQRYHRDDINAVAAYLHLEPFELLLPPDRAMAIRNMRANAETIIREVPAPVDFSEARDRALSQKIKKGTGTHG